MYGTDRQSISDAQHAFERDEAVEVDVSSQHAISILMAEENDLRKQVEQIRNAVQELQNEGDDHAAGEAAHMERTAGVVEQTANKVRDAIREYSNDPKKKLTLSKVNGLIADVTRISSISEAEIEEAETVHADAQEHKHVIAHRVAAQAAHAPAEKKSSVTSHAKKEKAPVKKEKLHSVSAKAPAIKAPVHEKEEEERSVLQAANEDYVQPVLQKVKSFSPVVVAVTVTKKAYHLVADTYHAAKEKVHHVKETMCDLASSAKRKLSHAYDSTLAYFGLGEDDETAPAKPVSKPVLPKKAIAAVRAVGISSSVKGGLHTDPSESLIPSPFGQKGVDALHLV